MRRAIGLLLAVIVLAPARPGSAQPRESVYTPSVFAYGFHGFFLGGMAGLGGGYIAARSGGWHHDDWQPLAYGAGIGALAGGALGLGLGITDMVNETPGRGYFILRDGGYGLGFGVATGAIAGGIAAVSTKKPENILFGASIGGLVGTGVGVVLGIIEGNRAWRRRSGVAMTMTIAAAEQSNRQLAWLPALVGRY
jgi:hypothetical protein